jgi:hypothetical protein
LAAAFFATFADCLDVLPAIVFTRIAVAPWSMIAVFDC